MAENFNLIFGSNAPDSTTWSDADYQNGWATVGSTPPTAEQFDFLQNRADLKAKELKDTLDPLVNRAAEEGRHPSTAYALGDTATANGIPVAWYLECTTPGTTDSSDITIPSPLTAEQTITDGTVTWTVRKSASTQDLTGYLTVNGGVATNDFTLRSNSDAKRVRIVGATQYGNGASLDLYGGQASEGGVFILATADGNNIAYFQGYPNGDLAWKVNNTAYSLAETAVASKSFGQNGYIKYKSGLTIQWGFHEVGTNSIALPVAFTNNKYSLVITPYSNTTSIPAVIVTAKGPNWVNIAFETAPTGGAYWMAMGY